MATCGKGIENTHPFVQGETALIHNGVINNAHMLKNVTSTCDSETILNEYIDRDVAGNPDSIQGVADALRGYYACGVVTKANGRQVVDIFKDARANLVVGYVKALGAYVYCTTEEILRKTARACGMTVGSVSRVNAGYHIRIDAVTGEVLFAKRFKSEQPSIVPSFSHDELAAYNGRYGIGNDGLVEGSELNDDAEFQDEVYQRAVSGGYIRRS
jgi:glucosamine 6-phosphate synthetase-like amidotransferase/phosphosugar isomerase protein